MRRSPRLGVIVLAISVAVALAVFAMPPDEVPAAEAPDESVAAGLSRTLSRNLRTSTRTVPLSCGPPTSCQGLRLVNDTAGW